MLTLDDGLVEESQLFTLLLLPVLMNDRITIQPAELELTVLDNDSEFTTLEGVVLAHSFPTDSLRRVSWCSHDCFLFMLLLGVEVGFNESTYTVTEGTLTPTQVCVELTGELGISVTINVDFTEDTASSQDFSHTDLTLTFDGSTSSSQCFELNITIDTLLEEDETFNIQLSSPDDVVDIVGETSTVTILDSTELLVGFVTPNRTVAEGGTFLACVMIFSGQLAPGFTLPLRVVVFAEASELDIPSVV